MKICANRFDVYPKVAFAGTRGSYGTEALLELEFDEGWGELSKTVSFYPSDGSDAVSVVLGSDTSLKIPYEVMSSAGQARYVISGTDGENTIISVTGVLQIIDTLDPALSGAAEPTAEVIDQILAKVSDAQDAAQDAADSAEACEKLIEGLTIDAEATKAYAESAAASAEKASADRETSEAASLSALSSAQSAADSEVNSKSSEENAAKSAASAKLYESEARKSAESMQIRNFANAIVGKSSGAMVRIEDVSSVSHPLGVRFVQKNLISYPLPMSDQEVGGVSFEDDGDGVVTVSGEVESELVFTLADSVPLDAGTYTIGEFSLGITPEAAGQIKLRIASAETGGYLLDSDITNIEHHAETFTVAEKTESARITLQVTPYDTAMTLSGSMEPYLLRGANAKMLDEFSSVVLTRSGKNLASVNELTYEDINNGATIFEGDITGTFAFSYTNDLVSDYGGAAIFRFHFKDGTVQYGEAAAVTNIYSVITGNIVKIDTVNWAVPTSGGVYNIQLEAGDKQTDFEPYAETTIHAANEDGTVLGVGSVYPTTTLVPDTEGVIIEAEYNKDTNKVIEKLTKAIASLGGDI